MTSVDNMEISLSASKKKIAALILQTYRELNKELKFVRSRLKRCQAYRNLVDQYCKEKHGDANGLDQNSTMVRLNVSGKVHIIKRSTMLLEGDNMNFLYLMISDRWDCIPPRDHNGVIFVDLDPALITPILDKLRFLSDGGTNEQFIPRISIDRRAIFNSVVSYFRIGNIVYGDTDLSEVSKIECMNDPRNIFLLHSFLPSDLTKMRLKFELLYRGSRDGMTAADFYRMCDDKNNTISMIKDSNGNVFGGFADIAWGTQQSWVKSYKSFLFSLKSSWGNEVVKFPVNAEGYRSALYHFIPYMCAFGDGDLSVFPHSSIDIGTSYRSPTPRYSGQYCTGGCKNFQFLEIEVYQVIQEASEVPVKFNIDDLHIIPRSFIETKRSPLVAVPDPTEISNIYTTETSELSSNFLYMAKVAQMAEEKLLLELMWIEHLSVPMSKRNLFTGLLAEWQRVCEESADVLPLSNGVVVTSCRSETLKKVEESMERLQIKVGPKIEGDSTEDKVKSVITDKAHTAVDDVISFNVGGTIIAVLRNTLLLQAPNSTFAAKYSDRWVQQPDELDECGNIYMVRKIWHHSVCIISSSSAIFFLFSSISPSFTGMMTS